jgi:hypothetical protein
MAQARLEEPERPSERRRIQQQQCPCAVEGGIENIRSSNCGVWSNFWLSVCAAHVLSVGGEEARRKRSQNQGKQDWLSLALDRRVRVRVRVTGVKLRHKMIVLEG